MRLTIQICLVFSYIFNSALAADLGMWRHNTHAVKLIGEGTLKVFFWEIYDLRLFSETTFFSWKNSFILEFDHKRDLKKDKVIETSLKEIRRQKGVSEKEIAAWQEYLKLGIKTVEEGTKAAVGWRPDGEIAFYYEGSKPIIITDEAFARSFINIWLGEETSKPGLRAALLGQD
jgi:hypothetical protein